MLGCWDMSTFHFWVWLLKTEKCFFFRSLLVSSRSSSVGIVELFLLYNMVLIGPEQSLHKPRNKQLIVCGDSLTMRTKAEKDQQRHQPWRSNRRKQTGWKSRQGSTDFSLSSPSKSPTNHPKQQEQQGGQSPFLF